MHVLYSTVVNGWWFSLWYRRYCGTCHEIPSTLTATRGFSATEVGAPRPGGGERAVRLRRLRGYDRVGAAVFVGVALRG